MRKIMIGLAFLICGSPAMALPCVGDYQEYRRRLLRTDWKIKEECPAKKVAHMESFPELCWKEKSQTDKWSHPTAYFISPKGQTVAFTVIYEDGIGLCVPPNIEGHWDPFVIIPEEPVG